MDTTLNINRTIINNWIVLPQTYLYNLFIKNDYYLLQIMIQLYTDLILFFVYSK